MSDESKYCARCECYHTAETPCLMPRGQSELAALTCSPTPETDRLEYEQECNYDVSWEDHARKLERERDALRHCVRQLIEHRSHVAEDAIFERLAALLPENRPNSADPMSRPRNSNADEHTDSGQPAVGSSALCVFVVTTDHNRHGEEVRGLFTDEPEARKLKEHFDATVDGWRNCSGGGITKFPITPTFEAWKETNRGGQGPPVKTPEHQEATEGGSLRRLVSRRCDARMDADGHCTVCGCEVREYEGGTDAEAMAAHICPPGFRTTTDD